ncbi:MAG: response regulator [Cytophagaceae bacterium]|nr:response regulator [Cytophagaceae bacterium]
MQQPLYILLVEDDEDDIAFFNLALDKQTVPTRLTTLTKGSEVLPYLETTTERPDLMILDMNLPRLHGRDVLVQTKKSPVGRDLPVFILTTSSAQGDADFCLANGAEQFMTKPTSLAELSGMLADVLRTTRHREPSQRPALNE